MLNKILSIIAITLFIGVVALAWAVIPSKPLVTTKPYVIPEHNAYAGKVLTHAEHHAERAKAQYTLEGNGFTLPQIAVLCLFAVISFVLFTLIKISIFAFGWRTFYPLASRILYGRKMPFARK